MVLESNTTDIGITGGGKEVICRLSGVQTKNID